MLSGAQEFQLIASYYVMVQFQYIVFNDTVFRLIGILL